MNQAAETNYTIDVKCFTDLKLEEITQLETLTREDGLFPKLLKDTEGYEERYAALAKQGDTIIGWAAVDISDEVTRSVGAFTRTAHRGRGVAKACIEQVLKYANTEMKTEIVISCATQNLKAYLLLQ